ncbi:hypothetical protein SDC9_177147 [bioreactor metagenome]|uniref:Uncharacterized protein n=1 Tax=bioreactor metagenome TaxID=1076179 RepID=A0A645H064_9ZZZZ
MADIKLALSPLLSIVTSSETISVAIGSAISASINISSILITSSLDLANSSLLFSGKSILETIILPKGTKAPPINKYSIGIPIPAYPIRTVADILPIPDIKTSIISLSLIPGKYFDTRIGDSVCPRNIFATATKLSTLLVPRTLPITPPITLTTAPIIPK